MNNADYLPNSYQTPNVLVDKLMKLLTLEEWAVLSVAIREIIGWREKIADRRAKISLSRFADISGIGRETIITALGAYEGKHEGGLVKYGLLTPIGEPDNKGQEWELTFDTKTDYQGLLARWQQKHDANKDRTAKARKSHSNQREQKRANGDYDQWYVGQTDDSESGMSDRPGGWSVGQTQQNTESSKIESSRLNTKDSAPANAARVSRPKAQSMVEGYTPPEPPRVAALKANSEPEKKESSAKERNAQNQSPAGDNQSGDTDTKPAKKSRGKRAPLAKAYSSKVVFDAISDTFFGVDDPEDAEDMGGRIGECRKTLIKSVLRKRKQDDLSEMAEYELGAHVRAYGLWWDTAKNGAHRPRDDQKFMGGWHEYTKSPEATALQKRISADLELAKRLACPEKQANAPDEPETYEHPAKPGLKLTKAQYRQLLASAAYNNQEAA